MATTTTPQTLVGPGNITHTEWTSSDVKATCDFLGTVFGWRFQDAGGPQGPYMMFGDPEVGVGGAVRPVMEHEAGPGATPYVSVTDLDGVIKKAEGAGAKTIVPKTPVEKMGWFAWFQAPGGIVVAAWQNDADAPPMQN